MHVFNRVIVSLVALAFTTAGVIALLVTAGIIESADIPVDFMQGDLQRVETSTSGEQRVNYAIAIGLITVGALVLIAELRSLFAGPRMVLIRGGEEGSVRLALHSITELANRTGRAHRSVKSLKNRVRVSDAGLDIRCEVDMNLGADVPQVSGELQESIKETVERMTGLPVADVKVRASYSGAGELSLVAR